MQITRFGRPEVLDVVHIPGPEAGPGQELDAVSAAGINHADTQQRLSVN
ncbi:Zn-dependent oxidoreductase [Geodermatophilus sp. URMC 62]